MHGYRVASGRWERFEGQVPKPGAGEVLVKVHAVSVNFRDFLVMHGTYPMPCKPNPIPGSDGAGEVVEVGAGVTGWSAGDRVMNVFLESWQAGRIRGADHMSAVGGALDGMLAEYVVRPAAALVRMPAHLSYEEGSTLACAGVTAWNAIYERVDRVAPGGTLLTQGSGGVSVFALQLARAAGLEVIVTTGSPHKVARLLELGAAHVIDTSATPAWHEEALRLTGGEGVDQVIELAGGASLEHSLHAVRFDGVISYIGALSGLASLANPLWILGKSARVQGIFVGSRAMFEALVRAVEAHRLTPVVDRVVPFASAPEAIELLMARGHVGKIVIRVAP